MIETSGPNGDTEYQTVILGALLHDIGKLLQRGTFGSVPVEGQHPQVSANFISAFRPFFQEATNVELLLTLVQRHHENARAFPRTLLAQETPELSHRPLALLVSRADNLSSYERGKRSEQFQDFKNTPLRPVFSTLEVDGRRPDTSLTYPATALGAPESLVTSFPQLRQDYATGSLTEHIRAFGSAFQSLVAAGAPSRFDVLLSHMVALLERFAWCIPANTQEDEPDVSLYDHSVTAAAIAACLYQYHRAAGGGQIDPQSWKSLNSSEFVLAVGDVSGIQSYIFEIARVGTGRIARRLRARSLYIQLIVESAYRTILERLRLPPVNRIMGSGGKFYLLLPNIPDTLGVLEEVQSSLDAWCLAELHGEVALHLAWQPFEAADLRPQGQAGAGFGERIAALNLALAGEKRRRFQRQLQGVGGWREDRQVIGTRFQGEAACRSCRKFPATEPEDLCPRCHADAEVGCDLPRARLLQFRDGGGLRLSLPFGSADVLSGPSTLRVEDQVMVLNDLDITAFARRRASARYLANHIPRDVHGEALTFEDIAAKSTGRSLLGFLKMDVDRLGETVAFGLKRSDGEHRDSISRMATLSRSLDLFFSGWVQRLLGSPPFESCYTVFSGGDDLFVVGPWDTILRLASEVREDFRRWVGRDDLTISAGVVLGREHLPISQAAATADDALKVAKNQGRDRITILDRTHLWGNWHRLLTAYEELRPEAARITSSTLYRLLELGRMWEDYQRGANPAGLRVHPLLAYAVARSTDLDRAPRLMEWLRPALELRPQDPEVAGRLESMALLIQLLIYASHERRD